MVFKRRDRRPILRTLVDAIYPRGGWGRAFHYVKHRIRRLPDSPERIARGIAMGVFTSFTPFYGVHFVIAAVLARIFRGNIFAALMATFFGNPLTYVPIGVIALQTGYWLLGEHPLRGAGGGRFAGRFVDTWRDLRDNFAAMFTDREANWTGVAKFYDEIFFPYMIGGILPGLICGALSYYLSVRVIRAYQNRRTEMFRANLENLRKAAAATARNKRAAEDDPED